MELWKAGSDGGAVRKKGPEVGIYKRKQESKKTRTRPRKRSRKQEKKKENKNSTNKK